MTFLLGCRTIVLLRRLSVAVYIKATAAVTDYYPDLLFLFPDDP